MFFQKIYYFDKKFSFLCKLISFFLLLIIIYYFRFVHVVLLDVYVKYDNGVWLLSLQNLKNLQIKKAHYLIYNVLKVMLKVKIKYNSDDRVEKKLIKNKQKSLFLYH